MGKGPSIVKSEIISKPGAALQVTLLTLSDEAKEALTVDEETWYRYLRANEHKEERDPRLGCMILLSYLVGFVWGAIVCWLLMRAL